MLTYELLSIQAYYDGKNERAKFYQERNLKNEIEPLDSPIR